VTLIDGIHPAIEVANRPPCLLAGLTVNIHPKRTNISNMKQTKKDTIALETLFTISYFN
jgi:hypothetical protein